MSRCWCFEISQVQFRRVALCVCICVCACWLWHIQFNLYEYLACQPFPWRISKQTFRAYSHQNESGSESVKDKRINSKQKIFFVLSRSLSLGLIAALANFIDPSIGRMPFLTSNFSHWFIWLETDRVIAMYRLPLTLIVTFALRSLLTVIWLL